jgi:3',5'-cyclic AMP phosphodiesterase CpdA
VKQNDDEKKLDRRGFLGCMAWVGTGAMWTLSSGVLKGMPIEQAARAMGQHDGMGGLRFAQISDSHIGFHKEANPDVVGSLRRAIGEVNSLADRPAFVVHTGDITHLSKPEEFDSAQEILKELKVDRIHYVPGEHDALDEGLTGYLKRFDQSGRGKPYYSFDDHGVHFVGLSNVLDWKVGSLALLGDEQLAWLKNDLAGRPHSTPIVVLAHIPLWTVYDKWGWGTGDAGQALALLKPFGSVTVLNGHIHQVMQKVEGNVAFHTALSTAYPQPQPGTADSPGPLTVAAGELGKYLGTRQIHVVPGNKTLATVDTPLGQA